MQSGIAVYPAVFDAYEQDQSGENRAIVSNVAKIAYLLLAHADPDGVIAQARALTAMGDYVVIHYDRRAERAGYTKIRQALADTPSAVFTRHRLACGWGTWSLVKATLEMAQTALTTFPRATHFYLISGDCLPIKSAEQIHTSLAAEPLDHIETASFLRSDWIKTGMKEERLIYRHPFNERTQRRAFYTGLWLQRHLGLTRAIPAELDMRIGSQWWCLRRSTLETVLGFARSRRDITRFFSTTWIPDEIFFQTLVRHLVPRDQITGRPPTFLLFTDYGLPVSFYDDHTDFLLRQDGFFARKISPGATGLRDRLRVLYAQTGQRFDPVADGKALHAFVTRRGRVGQRFGARAWDLTAQGESLPDLTLVLCSPSRDADQLGAAIGQVGRITPFGHVFDDTKIGLPDFGGLEHGLAKRRRHPAAFLRVMADMVDARHLVVCLDPAQPDLVLEICAQWPGVQVLDLPLPLDNATFRDLARTMGLSATTPAETLHHVLRVERAEMHRLLCARLTCPVSRYRPQDSPEVQARALAQALSVSHIKAQDILRASGFQHQE